MEKKTFNHKLKIIENIKYISFDKREDRNIWKIHSQL